MQRFFLSRFFSLFLILLCCGCATDNLMESGTYKLSESEEFVSVTTNVIIVHLYNSEKNQFIDKQYNYSVLPDQRIQFYPLTSVDAAFGIGKYDWFLKDGSIERIDRATKKSSVFELKKINNN